MRNASGLYWTWYLNCMEEITDFDVGKGAEINGDGSIFKIYSIKFLR